MNAAYSDEHAQLALASILGIDAELDRKAGRDAAGEPWATGSHFTGIVSWQNPKLKGTKKTQTDKFVTNDFSKCLTFIFYYRV